MRRYFNTKEAAERHLEYRKKCAIKHIEKRGDKVAHDKSYVYQDNVWKYLNGYLTETDKQKWFTFLGLVTYELIMDLLQMKGMMEIQEEDLFDGLKNPNNERF